MNINMETFMQSLSIVGQGMFSIFVVMFVIFMVVHLLIRLTKNEKEEQ